MAWADSVWLKNKLNDIHDKITSKLSSTENNIKTSLSNTQTAIINNDNTNRDNIKTNISNTQTAIINNDNNNKNTLANKVDSVKSVVDTTKTNVDTIKSDVSTSKTNISSLTDKVTTLTSTINTINTNVNTVKTEVSEVKQSIGGGLFDKSLICLGIGNVEIDHHDNNIRKYYMYVKILYDHEFYDSNFNKFTISKLAIMHEYDNGSRDCARLINYETGSGFYYIENPVSNIKKIYCLGYNSSDVMVYKEIFTIDDIIIPNEIINKNDPDRVLTYRGENVLTFKFNQLSPNKTSIRAFIRVYSMREDSSDHYDGQITCKFIIRNKSDNSLVFTDYIHRNFFTDMFRSNEHPGTLGTFWYSNTIIEFTTAIPSQYCNPNYTCEVIIDMKEYIHSTTYSVYYSELEYTYYFCHII